MALQELKPTDVLVVGAGPTGMVAAALLERLGVSVRILDPYPSRLTVPRAHVIGPVSLDVLAQAGFDVERICAAARAPGEDQWVSFRTTLLGTELGRMPYEYQSPEWTARRRVNLAQPQFEAILQEELTARAGIDVVIGRWTGLLQTEDGVTSSALVDGEPVELESRYLLAADGANSAVRLALGVERQAYAPPVQSLSIHIEADLRPWLDDEHLVLGLTTDPAAAGSFILYDPASEATFAMFDVDDGAVSADAAAERIRLALGRDDVPFTVKGTARWEMASEVADRFRVGQAFLLGDAAHRLPPTGGLGMNSGIQDSANLAWKLAAVLHGWADDALLDTYDSERRPIAVAYTRQSSENNDSHTNLRAEVGRRLTSGGTAPGAADMERLAQAQWIGFNCPGLQLNYGYGPGQEVTDPGGFTPSADIGRRLPHIVAGPVAVIDLVDPRGFTVFVRGDGEAWRAEVEAADVPVAVVDLDAVVDDTLWLHRTGLATWGAAIVVRPDGHVVERCSGLDDWPRVRDALAAHARRGTGVGTEVAGV